MFTSTLQPTKKAHSVARNCFAIILSRIVALLSIMLLIILEKKKKTEIKATLVLEGWVLGDTHFTGSHIGGDTLITRDVRGYTYHCDIGNAIPSIFRNTFLVN